MPKTREKYARVGKVEVYGPEKKLSRENSCPNIFRCDINYVPMEESQKVHNNSSELESLRTPLNAVYVDVIKNAESAQIKFPLEAKARENV